MNLNELAEKAFEKHWRALLLPHEPWMRPHFDMVKDEHFKSFLAAFHLLSGIVEQQRKALEFYGRPSKIDGRPCGKRARLALAATKLAIEEMGG